MSQIFDTDAEDEVTCDRSRSLCRGVQKKTAEKDGYEAVQQLGFEMCGERSSFKPELGPSETRPACRPNSTEEFKLNKAAR